MADICCRPEAPFDRLELNLKLSERVGIYLIAIRNWHSYALCGHTSSKRGEQMEREHMTKSLQQLLLERWDYEFRDVAMSILAANGYRRWEDDGSRYQKFVRTVQDENGDISLVHVYGNGFQDGNSKVIKAAANGLVEAMKVRRISKGLLLFSSIRPTGFPDDEASDELQVRYIDLIALKNMISTEDDRNRFNEYLNKAGFSIIDGKLVTSEQRLKHNPFKISVTGKHLVTAILKCPEGGLPHSRVFEQLGIQALSLMFGDQFAQGRDQHVMQDGDNVVDYLATLNDRDLNPFWLSLRQDFRSRYIVFEFKNSKSPVTRAAIDSTKNYLFPNALRSVAFIISRYGGNAAASKQSLLLLRDEGKIVIVLDQNELIEMLRLYDEGYDSERVLARKVEGMLEAINSVSAVQAAAAALKSKGTARKAKKNR